MAAIFRIGLYKVEMWLSAFLKLHSKSKLKREGAMCRCMHAIRCSLAKSQCVAYSPFKKTNISSKKGYLNKDLVFVLFFPML